MREPLANGSVERVLSDLSDLSAYAAFAFDAVYAFIIAINRLLHAGVAADAIRGEVLLREMRRTSFTGVSGEAGGGGAAGPAGPGEATKGSRAEGKGRATKERANSS